MLPFNTSGSIDSTQTKLFFDHRRPWFWNQKVQLKTERHRPELSGKKSQTGLPTRICGLGQVQSERSVGINMNGPNVWKWSCSRLDGKKRQKWTFSETGRSFNVFGPFTSYLARRTDSITYLKSMVNSLYMILKWMVETDDTFQEQEPVRLN